MIESGIRISLVFVLFFITGLSYAQTGNTRVVNGKTYQVHKVTSGETLYKISKKYGCTVKEIQDANKLGETLKIGQEVLIPGKEQAQGNKPVAETTVHKVTKGETLNKIAKQHNTTVVEIKRINNLSTETLKIGQILKVPANGVDQVATETPTTVVNDTPANKEVKDDAGDAKKPTKTEDKVVEVKRPAGPRQTESEKKESEKQTNVGDKGGMPATAEVVLAETATEKEENAMARVISDKMDQTRTFVVHPSLPKGSIIVVINETTGKMAYCRVVDNVKLSDLNGANLGITQAVADKIGLKDRQGSVKIKYAAP